jgi:hypothetical protein
VINVLFDSGLSRDPRSATGETLLTAGVAHPEFVRAVLQYGLPVDEANAQGETPLILAARDGYVETLLLLLQSGANPNATAGDGVSALMFAAAGDSVDPVRRLILADATVWARDRLGNTAIHFAARSGTPETVRLLLTAGADPNATNSRGEQPVGLAEENARGDQIIQILLTAGATRRDSGSTGSDADSTRPDTDDTDGADDTDNTDDADDTDDTDDTDDADEAASARPTPPDARNILYGGARPPRNSDGTTVVIAGYSSRIPAVWDQPYRSRENRQRVSLVVDNWYTTRVEVYRIDGDGRPEGVAAIEQYDSFELATQQGTTFVFYGEDGTYFGDYSTTGERAQRVRLDVRGR